MGFMAKSATISSKGQITLPKELREKYHLKEGETAVLLEIALAEFIYIALRGRIHAPNPRALIDEVVDQIRASEYLALSSLPPTAWDTFLQLNIPELHDRMVVADAVHRGLPLITNDPAAGTVDGLRTVWR